MSSPGKFFCATCGKSYTWKAELAGKKAKCKCGHPLRVPDTDPSLADASDGLDDLAALGDGAASEDQAPATGPACPSCGSSVDPAAVICINCGHNLKTGKKLKTTKASAAATASSDEVMPGYRSYNMDSGASSMSPQKKKILALSLIGALVLIVAVVVIVTSTATKNENERQRIAKINSGPPILEKVIENSQNAGGMVGAIQSGTLTKGMENPNQQKAAESLAELQHRDRVTQRGLALLKAKGPPAKAWLGSDPKVRLYSYTHETSLEFIKEMEALGLTDIVLGSEPVGLPTGEMGASGVLATLPDDPAKRKKIFAWYRRIPKMIEFDDMSQDDVGQKNFWVQLKD